MDNNRPTDHGYVVVVFAQDNERWNAPSGRHVAIGRPDVAGKSIVRGMPAGAYYLVAVPSQVADREDIADPVFLTRMRSAASQVRLMDGEMKSISLSLIKPPGQ